MRKLFRTKRTVKNPKLKAKNIFLRFWYWLFKPKPELEIEAIGIVENSNLKTVGGLMYSERYNKEMTRRKKDRKEKIRKRS